MDAVVVCLPDHAHQLASVLARASEVLIYPGGVVRDLPEAAVPVLRFADPSTIAVVARLLELKSVTDAFCMCRGDTAMEFLGGVQRLAVVGVHHASGLRWHGSDWEGDAELVRGRELAQWLADQGYRTPLDNLVRSDAIEAETGRDQSTWLAAIPLVVVDLGDAMVATSRRGSIGDDLIDDIDRRLTAHIADAQTRCRVLLRWYGSGTGRCSGFPIHEAIPGRLLSAFPIDTVLSAVTEPADDAVVLGAVRHLASWRSRTDSELDRVNSATWVWLTERAQGLAEPDNLKRLRRTRLAAQDRSERG